MHARGLKIDPPCGHKIFLSLFHHFGGFKGSNPGQNCHFSSGFQRLWDLFCSIQLIKLCMFSKGGVPHSAGTGSKLDFTILLLHTKKEKVEFFSYPSCKFKNKSQVAYPYSTRPSDTHFMLSELSHDILRNFCSVKQMLH